jgi:hypothetical protein
VHTENPSSPSHQSASGFRVSEGQRQAWIRQLREMGLWREALRYEYESREPVRSVTYGSYPNRPEPVDPVRAREHIASLDDQEIGRGIDSYQRLLAELSRDRDAHTVELENARTTLRLLRAARRVRQSGRVLEVVA